MYEGDDMNTLDEAPPPEESNNKTFLWVAGILGGLVLLSLLCLGGYAAWLYSQKGTRENQQATQVALNVQAGETQTGMAQFDILSKTPLATMTATVTNTPVFQQASATPGIVISDPQTATVMAALTQAAQAQQTIALMPTSTQQMPNTGFVDEVGAPGLIIMALALVAVILLARRLRISPTR
jgi:hypothetical protein